MHIGERFKRYEIVSQQQLTPKVPVIVRIDGRSFHNWTKVNRIEKPFSVELASLMNKAARLTLVDIPCGIVYYQQSDEVSFLLSDLENNDTQGWFDYNVSKLTSVIPSIFTAHFNREGIRFTTASFDARAFNVPLDDLPNYFLWRIKDAERNSLSALAQSVYSHTELQGAHAEAQRVMLNRKGMNYDKYPTYQRLGVLNNRKSILDPFNLNLANYYTIDEYLKQEMNIGN